MARSAANSASRTFVWVILMLLIVGLAGFGAVSFSGNVRSVGTVGETPIPVTRYANQLTQDLRMFQQQTGQQFSMAQAQAFGLDRAALGKVVAEVALEDEAARIGLSVGDAEVQQRLLQVGAFQGFDGSFDRAVYRDALKRSNIGVAEFEDQLRAEAARGILQTAVSGGVTMPATAVDAVYRWAGERRSFIWTELTEDDLAQPVPAATPADLTAWYEAHPELYTLPEARAVSYAWITPAMLVDTVEVDEDTLRKLYDERQAQYNPPERRLVERLVFGSAEEAALAWARIDDEEVDFDQLVAERQLTLEDVDMGDVTREELGPAGGAVFALTEPGLVGLVDTPLGPAIIRMNGILAPETVSYDDARDELKDEYATDRARRLIADMVEQVDDLLAGGATLEEVAEETELELGSVEYTEAVSDGIAGYAPFRRAAAAAQPDDFPSVIELDDGGIFALRLDRVIAPQLQPFEAVAERVAADRQTATVKAALETLADELLPRITGGEDPATFGLTVNREDALTRNDFLADVPDGLVAKAFELAPGQAARIDGTAGTPTVALVRTDEVLPPDPEDSELLSARDAYASQMSQELAADVLDAYTRAVQARAGIRLDEAAVNAVNAQFQ